MFRGIDGLERISPEGHNAVFRRQTWFSIVSMVTFAVCGFEYMKLKAQDWMLDLLEARHFPAVSDQPRLTELS